ncbi:hypothetical protein [Pectobacterium brasiliense]|uniref:hypothetical protein n=1 Tax=Pectobacterium brasiliense TaxID=180957 RepID=UPI0032EAE069
MSEENKIKRTIKESLLRAKKIFEDRDEAIKIINYFFSEIQEEMSNEVIFETHVVTEGNQYVSFGVFARNGAYSENPKKLMLRYTFGKPNAFPMEIEVPSYGVYACSDLTEVNNALENIISTDELALNIISIAQEHKSDQDIPF